MMELLLEELLLTAFVAVVFSFLIAKLVSAALSGANSEFDGSHEKGIKGIGRLEVESGVKSKKRVRFAADEVLEKVEEFEGNRVDGDLGLVIETNGEKGCDGIVGKVETFRGEEGIQEDFGSVVEKIQENMMDDDLGGVIIGFDWELGCDGIVVEQSGVVIEEKRGNLVGDELQVKNVLDESILTGRNESEVFKDDVCGDHSGKGGVSDEGNSVNRDVGDLIVVEEEENEGVDGDLSVDGSDEFKVLEELVAGERRESNGTEEDRGDDVFDDKNGNVEVDDKISVGVFSDDVNDDQTNEMGILKDLVSEEMIVQSVLHENVVNFVLDELVIDKMIERAELASEAVVGNGSGDVMVSEPSEDQRTGILENMDVGDKEKGLMSDEDDWEGIERSEVEKVFAAASSYVDSGGKDDSLASLGSDVKMQLYGLHKVAMEGPCYEAQPMALKVSARAKWNAWQRLGNMSPEVAMEQYVSLLADKDPEWIQGHSAVDGKPSLEVASPGVPETNTSTVVDKQTNTVEMTLEPKFNKDGGNLSGSSNSLVVDNQ